MQVRYQAALRPDVESQIIPASAAGPQELANFLDDLPQLVRRKCRGSACSRTGHAAVTAFRRGIERFRFQPVARAVDGKSLLVEQVADPPDQQHFMVLVVTPIAASLDGLQLCKLLLPVAKQVRF